MKFGRHFLKNFKMRRGKKPLVFNKDNPMKEIFVKKDKIFIIFLDNEFPQIYYYTIQQFNYNCCKAPSVNLKLI